MAKTYLELVEGIEFPEFEQTLAFITWLADAHSWYKHLDHDGEAFFLFLDPFAGLFPNGEEVFDESRFHYNFRTTAQWRKQFGCWNYSRGHPVRLNTEPDEIYVPDDICYEGRVILFPTIHGASIRDMHFEARLHPKQTEYHQNLQEERWLQFQWMQLAARKFLSRLRSKLNIDPRED